jgi:hypothetical protein
MWWSETDHDDADDNVDVRRSWTTLANDEQSHSRRPDRGSSSDDDDTAMMVVGPGGNDAERMPGRH